MNINKLIETIAILEKGINIKTGEKLFNTTENNILIQELKEVKKVLKKEKEKIERRKNRPKRAKATWSNKEEKLLLDEYNKLKRQELKESKIINKLAIKHERTEGSIRSRLSRLV
jgi:hypothetical protein